VHPLRHVDGRHSRGARTARGRVLVSVVTPSVLFRDTSAASGPLLTAPTPDVGLVRLPTRWGVTRVARCAGESDERGSQSSSFRRVAFGELQGEVPGIRMRRPPVTEQPLLEAREGPALDGEDAGHPGSGHCATLALAKRLCRARDWIDSTGMPRPCRGDRRTASAGDPVEVRRLLQRNPGPTYPWPRTHPSHGVCSRRARAGWWRCPAWVGSITNTSAERREPMGRKSGRHSLDWRSLADEDAARKTAVEFVRDRVTSSSLSRTRRCVPLRRPGGGASPVPSCDRSSR